jgi:hypothetical protein
MLFSILLSKTVKKVKRDLKGLKWGGSRVEGGKGGTCGFKVVQGDINRYKIVPE